MEDIGLVTDHSVKLTFENIPSIFRRVIPLFRTQAFCIGTSL